MSIIDIFYGLLFLTVGIALALVFQVSHPVYYVALFLVSIWSLRLSMRIAGKNLNKGEDRRYATWRKEWLEKGRNYFLVRSFLQVFLLQGLVVGAVSLPLLVLAAEAHITYPVVLVVGVAIWTLGILFEAVADWQLDHFIKQPENKGKIMDQGLFRYSRRPNYFGESLIWWGMATIAASAIPLVYAPVAFLSPVLITYIVYAVTGPLTEAQWQGNELYEAYKQRTSYFLPLPPKQETS